MFQHFLDFLNGPTLASFCLFSNKNYTEKIIDFSRIRTRIVRVEGKSADL